MRILAELFFTFAGIGAFTFGGGYAMLSLIEHTCVEKKKWITHDEMMNITVIAESTPGPIAINCATYVGYKKGKLPGAIFATFGMILPSFIIIYLISVFFDNFLDITWVANAFLGIKAAVGILIVDAAVKMIKKGKLNAFKTVIIAVTFTIMMLVNIFSVKVSSLILMLIAAIVGLSAFLIKEKTGKEKSGQ